MKSIWIFLKKIFDTTWCCLRILMRENFVKNFFFDFWKKKNFCDIVWCHYRIFLMREKKIFFFFWKKIKKKIFFENFLKVWKKILLIFDAVYAYPNARKNLKSFWIFGRKKNFFNTTWCCFAYLIMREKEKFFLWKKNWYRLMLFRIFNARKVCDIVWCRLRICLMRYEKLIKFFFWKNFGIALCCFAYLLFRIFSARKFWKNFLSFEKKKFCVTSFDAVFAYF